MNTLEEMNDICVPSWKQALFLCQILVILSQVFTTVFLQWVNGVLPNVIRQLDVMWFRHVA